MIPLHDGLEFAALMCAMGVAIGALVREGLNDRKYRREYFRGKADGFYEMALLQAEAPSELTHLRRVK